MAKTEVPINFEVDIVPDKDGTDISFEETLNPKSGIVLEEIKDKVAQKTNIFIFP